MCSRVRVHVKVARLYTPPPPRGPLVHSYSSASLTFLLPAPEKLANPFTDATKKRKTERELEEALPGGRGGTGSQAAGEY